MRTRVAECDLRSPRPILEMDGYDQLVLLVRDGERPLAKLTIPMVQRVAALSRTDVQRFIAGWMSLSGYAPRASSDVSEVATTPEISVVICTRDRPRLLDRCLKALGNVRYSRHEVLVVDNASVDEETARIAACHGARCVREERPGLNRSRNRGIKEAQYDIVALIDDDVQVDREWLAGLAAAFEDPGVDVVTGLVLPLELETPAQHYFEMYGNGMSKGFTPRVFKPGHLTSRELITVQHIGVGANMAARKSVFLDVGGFDPALDVGTPAAGAGDLDMFHRVLAAGKSIRYEPLAMAWHQHRRDMEDLSVQIYNNGRSFGVYLLKLLRHGSVPRRSLLLYSWTWGCWLLGRVVRDMLGRHRLPTHLLWAEVRGALGSPFAFVATYKWSRLSVDGPA